MDPIEREPSAARRRSVRRRLGAALTSQRQNALTWRIVAEILSGLLIPFILGQVTSKGVPLYGSIILATTWFAALATTEILLVARRIHARQRHETALWDTYARDDALLSSMRKSIRAIGSFEHGENGLFMTHFRHRLTDLEQELRRTADSQSLVVRTSHLERSTLVLGQFRGFSTDVIRAVHFQRDNREFLDHLVREWFAQTFLCVQSGHVAGVHRIIVVDDLAAERETFTRVLELFHHTNPRYACVVVDQATIDGAFADFDLTSLDSQDFAVYGNHYSFVGKPSADARSGTWSTEAGLSEQLTKLFLKCWGSEREKLRRRLLARPVTVERLFELAESEYGDGATNGGRALNGRHNGSVALRKRGLVTSNGRVS